jgi:hypothetical protein
MAKKLPTKTQTTTTTPAVRKFVPHKLHAGTFPDSVVKAIESIASSLAMPVLVVCHGRDGSMRKDGNFNTFSRDVVYEWVSGLDVGKPVAVVLDSPGGDPRCSYQMASAIKDHCGSYAKSAATLFAVGAQTILLAKRAELGPLDMQIVDHDSESMRSVLEYVQSLERLEAFALRLIDDTMQVFLNRTGKKVGALLPHVMKFSTDLVRPLFENVDVVQYTQMARLHKVVEDYAIRLMTSEDRDRDEAEEIAHRLTSDYADHGYVIDFTEAEQLGLPVEHVPGDLASHMQTISQFVKTAPLFGVTK